MGLDKMKKWKALDSFLWNTIGEQVWPMPCNTSMELSD